MPVIQNVSVPAGDDIDVTFTMDADTPVSLPEADIIWRVYDQQYGVAMGDPLIEKKLASGITVPGSPLECFVVALAGSDTKGMLHNYFHEAYVKDVNDNKITVTVGVFTVTPTKIASNENV